MTARQQLVGSDNTHFIHLLTQALASVCLIVLPGIFNGMVGFKSEPLVGMVRRVYLVALSVLGGVRMGSRIQSVRGAYLEESLVVVEQEACGSVLSKEERLLEKC